MTRTIFVALTVLGLTTAAPVPARAQATVAKSATAAGMVKSVTTQSLTIASGGKDMTFTIDAATRFVGAGLTTRSRKGKIMATDVVGTNDKVRVTYHATAGGAMHAASVRITEKRKT